MSKKVFNPIVPPFDQTASSLLDLDSRNHSDLTNLTWSTAGHTIDTAVDFVGNNANNIGTLGINATSDHTIYNTSDDLYIKNPNSNKNIYFNINRSGNVANFIQLDATNGIFKLNPITGNYGLSGIIQVSGAMTGAGLTAGLAFGPTVTGASYFISTVCNPVMNVAAPVIAFYLTPTFGNVNRSMETIRSVGWTHTPGYTDTFQVLTEQSITRSTFTFGSSDAGHFNYNEIVLGGAYSVGDVGGVTSPNYTENIITLTGGATRSFGTTGSITQRGIKFSGYGTIPTTGTTLVRAIDADGGLFCFTYDYNSSYNAMLFGAGLDAAIGYDGTDFIINSQLVGTGDVRLPLDNQGIMFGVGKDFRLFHDGTNNIVDINTGELRISSDAGTTNYLAVEADGTIEFNGTATVWDDLRIVPGSFDRAGISDPSVVSYTPTGSSIATYLYEFQKDDIAYFTVQLPHGYKQGSDISVHIHWTPGLRGNEENGATVGWKVDYAWANIDGTFGAMSTADLSDACDGTDDKHQMTPAVTITGTGKNISSMLICNVKRTDTGADDTWAGTTTGNLPMLLEIDFYYEIDTIGSRTISSK